MRNIQLIITLTFFLLTNLSVSAQQSVTQSARQIPVVCDADVIVAGGSTAGVSAAVSAAKEGAKVFLIANRPYLGQDFCRTCQLWVTPSSPFQTDLEREIFKKQSLLPSSVPFKYTANIPSDPRHLDTNPPSRLNDGFFDIAASESVQYNDSVQIKIDLGREVPVQSVHLVFFQRRNDFSVQDFEVNTSTDSKTFQPLSVVKNTTLNESKLPERNTLRVQVSNKTRYLRLDIHKPANYSRILLGEVLIESEDAAAGITPLEPMQIKYTLEKALVDANVRFLYNCYPTEMITDAQGKIQGIVFANRAGRQAATAPVVIDATEHATIARIAKVPFTPFKPGKKKIRHIIIGGELSHAKQYSATQYKPSVLSGGKSYFSLAYPLELEMNNDNPAGWSSLVNRSRDLLWTRGQVAASEIPFFIPSRSIISSAEQTSHHHVQTLPLTVFQPKGTSNLYVLNKYADIERTNIEVLFSLSNSLLLGKRVGLNAAKLAERLKTSNDLTVAGTRDTNAISRQVKEFLNGPRWTSKSEDYIVSPEASLPVLDSYDVIVIGGGTSGPPAGIAAARKGAKTLVIEHLDSLGGIGTNGLIGRYCLGYRGGFTRQVDEGMAKLGGYKYQPDHEGLGTPWDVELKKEWWRRELRKHGADIWFGTIGCGAILDGDKLKGVVIASDWGRHAVLAKVVIDATGNSDIAAMAGAKTIAVSSDHAALQGTGLPPKRLGARYTNTDYCYVDDSDMVDTWRMYVAARHRYKDIYDLGQLIDTRERRQIVGEFCVSPADIYNSRTYPDTIAQAMSNLDTHGFTVDPLFLIKEMSHGEFVTAWIPYRSLLPQDLDSILVVGLGISAHRDAMPVLRMQPDVQNTGFAAGCAAAMALQNGGDVRKIELKKLQEMLIADECLPKDAVKFQDPHPLPKKILKKAAHQLAGYNSASTILFSESSRSIPFVRQEYDQAKNKTDKLVYAHTLAAMGDDYGAATLIQKIKESKWDQGWDYEIGFKNPMSKIDSYIAALGNAGCKTALDVILEKARQLNESSDFSHHRAVALYLENFRSPQAADVLFDLLREPGIAGYAVSDVNELIKIWELYNYSGKEVRKRNLRELILARALYRCGDHENFGQSILRQYTADLRGHYAKHAAAVLEN